MNIMSPSRLLQPLAPSPPLSRNGEAFGRKLYYLYVINIYDKYVKPPSITLYIYFFIY